MSQWPIEEMPKEVLDFLRKATAHRTPIEYDGKLFSTAHEAAFYALCAAQDFILGKRKTVPVKMDFRVRIDEEHESALAYLGDTN